MVEIKTSELRIKNSNVILKNETNEEIPYQLIYNKNNKPESIIFQATVKASNSVVYTLIKGNPAPVKPKTYGRQIPERKDDFAWENDLAAYRMYGPALANENPSNGVDIWLKRTSELVVDKRYNDELKNGKSYHIDHGDGLDCYKVGHTLGAGGIAPFSNNKLWVGNFYNSFKIHENGPLRTVFSLTYNNVKIENEEYKQIITITTDAGSMLNKAVVTYEGLNKPIKLAGGIFLHDGKGVIAENPSNGYIAYAENATSDAGLSSGRNYIGVYVPNKSVSTGKDNEHLLILSDYTPGESFTYYFGGGWSKWGYPTDKDWFDAMENFSLKLKQPLMITGQCKK